MSNSLPYIAYGFATNIFDDHTLDDKTANPIPSQPPVTTTHFPPGHDDNDDDHHNPGPFPPPSLPPGCRFDSHDREYVYTKNGKSARGSTCEIAKINWNIKYGSPHPVPVPFPVPVPRPKPVIIIPPHLPGLCVKDGHRYIFKGRVRCRDNRKHGCLREVIGKSCSDAKKNFCKLYGPGGRCVGDPSFTIQNPDSWHGDDDRNIVIKIIDDSVPGGVSPEQDDAEQKEKAAAATAAPAAPVAPAPPGGDLSDVLSGQTAGIPNVMLLAGAAMMLFMVMALRK